MAEGYSISREAAGIYRICGVVSIPVYIVVMKELAKGKSLETIADELEEDVEKIRPIVMLASKYAPDYDIDAIYNALKGEDK